MNSNYGISMRVCREGDDGDYFYVLEYGRANVQVGDRNEPQLLKVLLPGDCFGELVSH